jgi:ribonucleoside-triphosphate reductase
MGSAKNAKNKVICYDCKREEVYSRVVGCVRLVQQWNLRKQQEFKQRKEYKIKI